MDVALFELASFDSCSLVRAVTAALQDMFLLGPPGPCHGLFCCCFSSGGLKQKKAVLGCKASLALPAPGACGCNLSGLGCLRNNLAPCNAATNHQGTWCIGFAPCLVVRWDSCHVRDSDRPIDRLPTGRKLPQGGACGHKQRHQRGATNSDRSDSVGGLSTISTNLGRSEAAT